MCKQRVAMAVGLALCAGLTTAYADETVSGWDGGLGVGVTRLEPDTDGTTFRLDDSNSSGGKLFLGYDLNDRLAVEGYYSDLGEATLDPAGSINYVDAGVSAMYYAYQSKPQREGWSAFVRAGLGSMSNDSDVNYSRKNDLHLMLGAGLLVPLSTNWAARLDLDLYDEDSQLASIGVVWRFGAKAAPVSQPVASVAVAPAPVVAAAPQPAAPSDSDRDGVVDNEDRCPGTAAGTKVDGNGCELRESMVLEGVNFMTSSAQLTADSRSALDKVAASLKRYPELQVEVAGYTDSSGARPANVQLSQQRAESVRDYLIAQGVAPEKLSAKGFGPDGPIADNATVEGRAANRRVELHIK